MKEYILTSMGEFEEAEKYWLEKLSGELNEVKLYGDFPGAKQYMEAKYKAVFAEREMGKLMAVSKNNDLSLYIILLTIFKILLFKYLGQADIIAAAPIYTASNQKYNKYVIFRDRVYSTFTFKDLLLEVKKTVEEGYKNEHFSIENLVDRLDLQEGASLYRVGLLLENIHQKKEFIDDIRKDGENDIVLSILKNDGSLEAEMDYNSGLFKQETIQKILDSCQCILTQVLNNTGISISEVELMTAEEKEKILFHFNDTETGYPRDKTIHRLFEKQAEQTPHRTALRTIVDLSDIYEELTKDTVAIPPHLLEKIGKCCFKKNPFIFTHDAGAPGKSKPLKILKTHRHTCAIVNNNVTELLGLFDGTGNMERIFSRLKEMNPGMYVYPVYVYIENLFKISSSFEHHAEEFFFNSFEEFVRLVKLLYKNYFIDLEEFDPPAEPDPIAVTGITWEDTIDETVISDDLFNRSPELSPAEVLLIGDTPGMPTVGLLYMASYLWRNGIEARCHFHDLNGDYQSLKKNIRDLLDKVRPRIVGISMKWFPYIARVIEICKIVKSHSPGTQIVVGGNTASFYWQEVAAYDFVDYVVRGDGEDPLLKICQGADYLPNCVYKKEGKIITNPITYVHDETNSKDIYLSHLDKILISRYASLFGTFFIPTQKGCTLNCCYCGECRTAQKKIFGRKNIFRRGIEEVRKDIIEAKEYASMFMFDLIESNEYYVDYFKKITRGIDLSGHFCVYGNYIAPSAQMIDLMSHIFKYVYWELDMASLSQRHRDRLVSSDLVKIQPTDLEIIDFYNSCEKYNNGEVRMNLIAGMPYFTREDVEESSRMLSHIIQTYDCFSDFHWERLHAQPGAPIVDEAEKHDMYSHATTYEDFLKYSRMNFDRELSFPGIEDYNYPYVYFQDDKLNSVVSKHSADTRAIIKEYKEKKRRGLLKKIKITYRGLNERANQLARVLRQKGINRDQIVPLMMDSSLDMVVAVLGVLKAGAAYLPIDPTYPPERIKYMLKTGNTNILLIQKGLIENDKNIYRALTPMEITVVDDESLYSGDASNLDMDEHPGHLAYVIFTSGTTGKPKGVLVEHSGLVNYTHWRIQSYNLTGKDVTLQLLSYCFDGFASNFYSTLLSGGTLIIVTDNQRLDFDRMKNIVKQENVTNISLVPQIYRALLDSAGKDDLKSLRFVVLGGEKGGGSLIKKSREKHEELLFFNEYGPTEATVTATGSCLEASGTAIIGTPIANTRIYILDSSLKPTPARVPGELCIAGAGLARGYLNSPELTSTKFIELEIKVEVEAEEGHPSLIYKTGDLARWMPDGSIEILGRIDQQVKLRGFRIEPGEIENQLLKHEKIKNTVVLAKENVNGETYLCAYIVPASSSIDVSQLKGVLSRVLPAYMIPSYFIQLGHIPLTTSGKVDWRKLPEPESRSQKYELPANELEEKLTTIWAEVLDRSKDKIGVNDDFFQLGGHSLKATSMLNRIYKELNIKLNLGQVFNAPTIRKLTEYIILSEENRYVFIETAEKKEYYPLSSPQVRMYIVHQMKEGDISYNVPRFITYEGKPEMDKIENALLKLIKRHDSLRTSFELINGKPVQKIHEEVEFSVEHHEVSSFLPRDVGKAEPDFEDGMSPIISMDSSLKSCEEKIMKDFPRPFDLTQPPLLRAGLITLAGGKNILMVDMHHIICDGYSGDILEKEFLELYDGRELPPLKLQYKDFSQWQNHPLESRKLKKQQDYWHKEYAGEIPVLNLPTDFPRPAVRSGEGDQVTFEIGSEKATILKEYAIEEGATVYIVLLVLINIFLAKICHQEDIIIGTAVAGRRHPDLEKIIGMFVNTLALRNYPRGHKTFREFLQEVKERTLKAFENQDYQFNDLVEVLGVNRHMNRHPLFDIAFGVSQGMGKGTGKDRNKQPHELPKPAKTNTLSNQPKNKTTKFDLALLATETTKNLVIKVEYNNKLFKPERIERFCNYIKEIVSYVTDNKEIKLEDIKLSLPVSAPELELLQKEVGDFEF